MQGHYAYVSDSHQDWDACEETMSNRCKPIREIITTIVKGLKNLMRNPNKPIN